MHTTKIWTLLLAAALAAGVAAFGTASAQVPEQENDEAPEITDEPLLEDAEELQFEDVQTCAALQDDPLSRVTSFDISWEESSETSQSVSIEEDDVLLGVALANHGADDISFENLRDVESTTTRTSVLDQDSDIDEENVFSTLALGLTSDVGEEEALDCVGSFALETTDEHDVSRSVSLDEDDVLLSIALANSVDDTVEFDLVASIDEEETRTLETEQDVDVDRDETFLALALGAGS